MGKKKILFLDDEVYAKPYIDEIKDYLAKNEEKELNGDLHKFELTNVTRVWQALKKLTDVQSKYELLILDCMLPVDIRDKAILKRYDIKHGLRTGSAFVDYLIDNNIANEVKIIILTNIKEEAFHEKYTAHPRLSGCFMKIKTEPLKLVKFINNLIN